MHVATESPIWGVEDRVLRWSRAERRTLERAANLLAAAREVAGPDSPLGEDLGKGEVVLRDWLDGAVLESRAVGIEQLNPKGTQ